MAGSGDATARFRYVDHLHALIHQTYIEEIAPKRSLVAVESTATVDEVLQTLSANGIISAPVRDVGSGKCIGFVDTLDLVNYLWEVYSRSLQGEQATRSDAVFVKAQLFGQQQIGALIDFSRRNPFVPVALGRSVADAIDTLRMALHRVAVVSVTTGEMVSVVSQNHIVRFLARHVSALGPLRAQPLSGFIERLQPVITVPFTASTLDAFRTIHDRGVSAVGIVDQLQRLVAVLSASDLKGLSHANFSRVFLPVTDFLRATYTDDRRVMTPPVTCTLGTSLEVVLLRLAATGVHRVFVVDESERPIHVFSLTDLLRIVAATPPPAARPEERLGPYIQPFPAQLQAPPAGQPRPTDAAEAVMTDESGQPANPAGALYDSGRSQPLEASSGAYYVPTAAGGYALYASGSGGQQQQLEQQQQQQQQQHALVQSSDQPEARRIALQ